LPEKRHVAMTLWSDFGFYMTGKSRGFSCAPNLDILSPGRGNLTQALNWFLNGVILKYRPDLNKAILLRRYKRFLADIELPGGARTTIHCPNTGSMKNCAEPGSEVFYSTSENPKRKYAHTWELARTAGGHYIGINSVKANQLVREAIEASVIPELAGYSGLKTEVKYGDENSRIDLLLTQDSHLCYVEVKSVTLLESPVYKGAGFFPDAVSERGLKHLRELVQVVRQGHRAVLFFCVQHSGIRSVQPAGHIDPAYSEALEDAFVSGVEILAYKCRMSARSNRIFRSVPVELSGKFK
jgi:sugar fermentation stimulation protein A